MSSSADFESLPPELAANVLRHIADIQSLYNVLHASPSAWRCFNLCGAEIIERVLDADPMHFHIRDVIRTVAYVREAKLPVSSLVDFQRRIACEPIKHGADENGEEPKVEDAFCPARFPANVSMGTLREILATSRWMDFHSIQCLDFYMTRLRKIRPQRPVDPDFHIHRRSMALLRRHPSQVFEKMPPPDSEPAWTWTEEQLVIRAFWRTQLIADLKRALKNGIIVNWPEANVQKLTRMSTSEVYRMKWLLLECISIATWDVEGSGEYRGDSELTEHSLLLNVANYLQQESLAALPRTWSRPSPKPIPEEHEEWALIEHWSIGLEHFEHLLAQDLLHEVVQFDFFRDHGFAIWSQERLRQHGYGARNSGISLGSDFAAWTSVLPEEQLLRLDQWEALNNPARGI